MNTSPCIKEVVRSALVAFAPDAPFFAAGTMAGAVDMSFSSSANLEIFGLDFQSDDRNLPLAGSAPSSEPFNRLSWGKSPSSVSEEFSLGVVAGGLVDGNIGIWNPRLLISPEKSESSYVQTLSRHKGPVRGLDFCSLHPSHLASGAEEGDICIWDIAKPTQPTHFPPLKGTGSATQGEISFVSWNKKVQPILASTSLNGTTVVWDLRKQKPIISFSDSVRRRCSVLQWHPDFATQLIVASDDDTAPSLRLWDMRNTMTPLRELVGHTKGVVAMSWCPIDSSYLLTCGKDNRTICWDTNSAEIVSELPAGTNWNFDVHWYPKIPGVISASSFDGKIGVYNIEACARYGVDESYLVSAPLKAPKWYQRKAGVTFGFGGKLVSFHSTSLTPGRSEINVRDLVTELNLVSTSSEFEAAMKSGDKSSLRLLCEQKYQESESEDDKETWGFLKVMFEDDGTARTKLLNHLGFTLPAEVNETNQTTEDDLSHDMSSLNLKQHEVITEGFVADNGEDFFNNLPSPKVDTPGSTSVNKFGTEGSVADVEESTKESESLDGVTDFSFDDAVQRALVVGDYKGAVALCVAANKMADALVIAQVGGASLWETTRDQYLRKNHSPYLKVVAAMVNNDLVSLVNTRPLKSWKETLALLCTFAQREDWTLLCDTLASRLMAAGNTLAATLCYICAGNIDKTVEIWSKNVTSEHEGKSYVDLLQDLMEKTVVLALATGQKKFSSSLCKLVEKYAEILAGQGLLTTAMEYLNLMGTEDSSPELVVLRDRITLLSEPVRPTRPKDSANSQLPTAAAYGFNQQNSVVDPSRNYYQDDVTYNRQNYQQTPAPSYAPQYQQQPQQPTTFIPAPAPHTPPVGFTPQPPIQPAPKVFVPSAMPVMKNADQYQQAPSLGSQIYSVNASSNYQVGPPVAGSLGPVPSPMVPTPVQKMSQGVGPTPQVRGFMPMPISNTGPQRTSSGQQMQPPSPPQPAAPPAPPPTVHTADVSNVPAHQRAVISSLTRLFTETSEALGGSHAVPAKKREIDDNSKKLGALFVKLNSGDISKNASEKLVQLCQALDRGDFPTALKIQVDLTTSDWDECSFWLATLKRMIKIRQTAR
ncbi:putative transcription factor WD40-like family [Helianthus annuus]|uniref:Transcription factor WD40-like family n=1 Tax=Helianthus annuus TaxID=4232 RepID=A0A9K3E1M3_HELAN|nr:protein transport protein SEC31 homolog B isoform X2 [Helianthus annuus]KAF5764569.1 putative transcription factor WD40-like family [Helianthus annuus]KAJ0451227.1 putative transcription factor WD40-like family [Helianthus annuus]KAJ0473096.1 putative transcription factor WD40-like family [Helianthus annuus]KAJ0648699.1 putative transcription factor WD40-like family [Helianthus annuus]KAJ0652512.1 putative transcription factor WD40-like family [Helianthus annuus]